MRVVATLVNCPCLSLVYCLLSIVLRLLPLPITFRPSSVVEFISSSIYRLCIGLFFVLHSAAWVSRTSSFLPLEASSVSFFDHRGLDCRPSQQLASFRLTTRTKQTVTRKTHRLPFPSLLRPHLVWCPLFLPGVSYYRRTPCRLSGTRQRTRGRWGTSSATSLRSTRR